MNKSKNIIITGASQGLGHDLAEDLSKDNHKLFLTSRKILYLKKLKNKCHFSKNHKIFQADLTNIKNCSKIVLAAKSFFKNKIDIVIHVAGGGLGLNAYDIAYKDISKIMNLNFFSSMEINRLLLNQMIKRKTGNIIHVGSIASYEAVGSLAYNVAKASLAAYVRSMAFKVSRYNIVITGIAPGGFVTKNNSMYRLKKKNFKAYQKFIADRLPRKKMGLTTELIPMIKLLCSSNAGMMSGCLVPMDGAEGKSIFNL